MLAESMPCDFFYTHWMKTVDSFVFISSKDVLCQVSFIKAFFTIQHPAQQSKGDWSNEKLQRS